MTFKFIIIFLIGAWSGGIFAFHFIYSPKAQIKRLWKEIFEITKKEKIMRGDSFYSQIDAIFDSAINKRKKMIRDILDNYFDPEEDQDFIKENMP
jgi:hypothetical protein